MPAPFSVPALIRVYTVHLECPAGVSVQPADLMLTNECPHLSRLASAINLRLRSTCSSHVQYAPAESEISLRQGRHIHRIF